MKGEILMKNLRKAFAMVTALSAICMSASAFASTLTFDDAAVTGSFDDANTVTASVDTTAATLGTQMTFIILDADANELNLAAEDILYIDQKELTASSYTFTGVINAGRITGATDSTIPDGSYPVKLGYTDDNGDFGIAEATLVVSSSGGETTIEILWGDVNQDGVFNANDAGKIVVGLTGGSTTCGDYTLGETANGILWGDVNQDSVFNANDAGKIVVGLTGGSTTCGDYTLGETAEITVAAE